jgi:hypothetical protein
MTMPDLELPDVLAANRQREQMESAQLQLMRLEISKEIYGRLCAAAYLRAEEEAKREADPLGLSGGSGEPLPLKVDLGALARFSAFAPTQLLLELGMVAPRA